MCLFQPTYFSPIAQYAAMLQRGTFQFEVMDNYQKQTYRTRCYIYAANGRQTLSIPIKRNNAVANQSTKDVKIENNFDWQKEHRISLISAYRSSPFFEFYADDLMPLLEKKPVFLLDFLLACHAFVVDALQLDIPNSNSLVYKTNLSPEDDYRFLANCKQELPLSFPKYTQVFDDKHGFIPNLSILDLLFMEGPSSEIYLQGLNTTF